MADGSLPFVRFRTGLFPEPDSKGGRRALPPCNPLILRICVLAKKVRYKCARGAFRRIGGCDDKATSGFAAEPGCDCAGGALCSAWRRQAGGCGPADVRPLEYLPGLRRAWDSAPSGTQPIDIPFSPPGCRCSWRCWRASPWRDPPFRRTNQYWRGPEPGYFRPRTLAATTPPNRGSNVIMMKSMTRDERICEAIPKGVCMKAII